MKYLLIIQVEVLAFIILLFFNLFLELFYYLFFHLFLHFQLIIISFSFPLLFSFQSNQIKFWLQIF